MHVISDSFLSRNSATIVAAKAIVASVIVYLLTARACNTVVMREFRIFEEQKGDLYGYNMQIENGSWRR